MTRFPAAEVLRYGIPFTVAFRDTTVREGLLLRGPAGWGEFAPFPDYGPEPAARWLAAAVEMMTGAVPQPDSPDLLVPVSQIVPDLPAAQAVAWMQRQLPATGCHTVKVKVGDLPVDQEVARVAAIRTALDEILPGGSARIRLDVNGGWSPARAAAVLSQVRDFGIEYVEQPCDTAAELAILRNHDVGVPIAVDELLRRDRDFQTAQQLADVAIVKVAPLGGGAEVLRLVEQLQLPVVISSAAESSLALARDACVAAALPRPVLPAGLATGTLHEADVTNPSVVPVDGVIPAQLRQPDGDALARVTDSPSQAWLDRLEAAWSVAQELQLIPADQLDALEVAT